MAGFALVDTSSYELQLSPVVELVEFVYLRKFQCVEQLVRIQECRKPEHPAPGVPQQLLYVVAAPDDGEQVLLEV